MPSSHPPGRRHKRRTRTQTSHGPKREHISELTPLDEPPDIESFEEWDLGEEVQRAILNMDIVKPTPIQSLAIGAVLEGRDVIAKAETGTGKTLAFGAPLIAKIDPARATVLALVLCPTRELAQQVATVLEALALPRGIRVALTVGGDPMHPQIAQLQAGAQVVVGTPGRVLDLFQQRFLQFPWAEFAILDEADKMFEIGFADDVKKILSYLPDERQTLLFSATFPTEVLKLARGSTRDPVEVATKVGTVTADSIDQSWMPVDDEDRPLVLTRLFEQSKEDDIFLVFCERRTEVDRLLRRMERLPFGIKALHGGYDQASRFRVMSAFREGGVKALLATDVASRGLDVNHVTHVINYSVPRELEDYAHRIGRTGRAGRSGTAITLVPASQARKWRALLGQAKWEIPETDQPQSTRRGGGGARGSDRGRRPAREDREGSSRREEADRSPYSGRPRRAEAEGKSRSRSDEEPRRPVGRQARGESSSSPERSREEKRPERSRERQEGRPERSRSGRSERDARPERGSDDERPRGRQRDRGDREEAPRGRGRSERGSGEERKERPQREERGGRGEASEETREARPQRREREERRPAKPDRSSDTQRTSKEDKPFGSLPDAPKKERRPASRDKSRDSREKENTSRKPSTERKDSGDSGGSFGAGL